MITPPLVRCKVVTLLVAVIGVALSCFVLFAVPSPTETVKVSPVAVATDEGATVATTNSPQPTSSSARAIPNSDAPRPTVQQSSGASPPLRALPLIFPQADPALLSDDEWTSSHATWGERLGKAQHGDIVPVNGAVMGYVDKQSLCNTTTEAAVPALSSDKVVDTWIRDFAGQAAFAVSVVGKTFIARGATVLVRNPHTKQCHYLHLFRGPSGATLTVTRVLSAYRSLDETADTVRIFDKVKVAQVVLSRNGAADVEATTTASAQGCLHHRMPHVTWVSADVAKLKATAARDGGLRYFPWRHSEYQLQVRDCHLRRVHVQPALAAEACSRKFGGAGRARGARILFTGDSHVRVLFRHVESMIFNTVASLKKGGNMSTYRVTEKSSAEDIARPRGALGYAVQADFYWDPYLDSFAARIPELASSYDAVVFGIGAWPASFGQWSITRFHKRMCEIRDAIKRVSGATHTAKFVWVGGPAMPKPRQMPGFRITNYRLGTFNTLGGVTLGEAGVSWLDVFGMTLPVPKWNRGDGMHFDQSVVPYAAIDWLLSGLCF